MNVNHELAKMEYRLNHFNASHLELLFQSFIDSFQNCIKKLKIVNDNEEYQMNFSPDAFFSLQCYNNDMSEEFHLKKER